MHNTDYAYSVTSIRVKESSLLGQVEMDQLMAVSSYPAALAFLADHGWEVSSPRQPANSVLRGELMRAWDLLCEVAPDITVLHPLILRKDYHNLKAGIKSKLSGFPVNTYFLSPSTLSHSLLTDAVTRREFTLLPEPFAGIGEAAYDVLVRTGDGQLADIMIDRIALTDILTKAKATENKLMIEISEMFCAAANIKTAVRAAKTDRNEEFLRRALSECDSLDTERLITEAAAGISPLLSYLGTTSYAAGIAAISTAPAVFEKWCDDKIIGMLEKTKFEFFGPEPLIAYYLMKEAEIKNVRILLSAKENDIPAETVRQRLRRHYA